MGAKKGFVDWKMEGALQARRLWKDGGESLENIALEPPKAPVFAHELTPQKANAADVSAYRRGYRHELHVLNLRKEAQTHATVVAAALELEPLKAMNQAFLAAFDGVNP